MKVIHRPTVLTLLGTATAIAAISGTTGYVLGRAPSLPPILAVHFDAQGIADRFVQATYPIVLVPVWIQLTLAIVFGAIAGVLLYRTQPGRSAVEDALTRQDRERMLMTAEAIALLAATWITFQSLLTIRLFMMWQRMCCGLGSIYYQSLVVCIVLSVVIGIRAAVYIKYPHPVMLSVNEVLSSRFTGAAITTIAAMLFAFTVTSAITPNRTAARSGTSSIRATSECSRDFSTSRRLSRAITPLASPNEPRPANTPAAITTRPAISVVASTSCLLAAMYAATMMVTAPARSAMAGAGRSSVRSQPLNPAVAPSIVNVRMPPKRALGPSACPDH